MMSVSSIESRYSLSLFWRMEAPSMRRSAALFLLFVSIAAFPLAQTVEKLDYETIGRIRDEGLNRSQVMDHIGWLAGAGDRAVA